MEHMQMQKQAAHTRRALKHTPIASLIQSVHIVPACAAFSRVVISTRQYLAPKISIVQPFHNPACVIRAANWHASLAEQQYLPLGSTTCWQPNNKIRIEWNKSDIL
jgi:hypothetical protein